MYVYGEQMFERTHNEYYTVKNNNNKNRRQIGIYFTGLEKKKVHLIRQVPLCILFLVYGV